MTEKEFLESFCRLAIESGYLNSDLILTDLFIDSFIEEYHKEYFEVEFIKKNATEFYGIPLIFDPQLKEDTIYLIKGNKILGIIKDIDLTIPDPIDIQPQGMVVKDLFGNTKEERETKEGIKGFDY
jgi:hypothetical protein